MMHQVDGGGFGDGAVRDALVPRTNPHDDVIFFVDFLVSRSSASAYWVISAVGASALSGKTVCSRTCSS